MLQVRSKYQPGTVGYIQANRPRFQKFFDSMESLIVPLGTGLERASNYNAAHNRNELVDGIEGEWLWFLDDDHAFQDDTLMKLLDRNVDIIVPLYCRRYAPFEPVIFKKADPIKRDFELYTWQELSTMSGMIEVAGCGAGGLLVRKNVFAALEKPYFRVGASHCEGWSLEKDVIGEDTGFCWAAQQAGFKIHCDLEVPIAHIPDEMLLVPMRQANGAFNIMSDVGNHRTWLLPEQQPQRKLHLLGG